MRPTHKNRNRNRHRSGGSGGGGGGGNPLSRVYESNGPDVKVRGTAQTVADKYLQLGRDAQSSGDIVMAESYFQHAEHYLRIVFAAQAFNQQNQQHYRRPDEDFDDEDVEDQPEMSGDMRPAVQPGSEPDGLGEQPAMDATQDRPPPQGRPPRDFNREGRDQGQGREGRDRFRPRWQDRRGEVQPSQPQQQPRNEDQPASAAPDSGRWEAPSFLRRPAGPPAPAEAAPPDEPAPDQPAAKRRYERRPRKEAAETSTGGDGE
jgi:hypothetical protein